MSVLQRSGQSQKAVFFVVTIFVACIILVVSFQYSDGRNTSTGLGLAMMLSVVVGLTAFACLCTFCRCPNCKERWFWRGVSDSKKMDWPIRVLVESSCPNCGWPGCGEDHL